jgi:TolA-binding protein
MPKIIKKKISKRASGSGEEVEERLAEIRDTLVERQRMLLKISAGVLLAVIVIAGLFFHSWSERKKAIGFQQDGYAAFHAPAADPSVQKEQYKKALDLFAKAYDTKKLPVSLYYIGASHYELGNFDQAIDTFDQFVRKYQGEELLLPLAYQKLASSYMRKGDAAGASKTLDALYKSPGSIYQDLALIEHGKLLEKEGKSEEARKKYEELVQKFPQSPFLNEAKARLSERKEG